MSVTPVRTGLVGLARVVFGLSLVVLIGAQVTLMSVLDADRADQAATAVSTSPFAQGLVEDAVEQAVVPIAGAQLGSQIAEQASTDPRIAAAIRAGLLEAHRSVVEPSAPDPGELPVDTVIADLVLDAERRTGVDLDLDRIQQQLRVPTVDPRYVPDSGVRSIAERIRNVALVLTLVAVAFAVVVHPRPGRSLSFLGVITVVVCVAWGLVLLGGNWLIEAVDDTLYGQLTSELWSASLRSMVLIVAAGALVGVGLWFAGIAIDGVTRRRPRGDHRG